MKEKLLSSNKIISIFFFNVLVSSFAFGQNWLPLQEGLNTPLSSFFILEETDELLITGGFNNAMNGVECNGICIWDGNNYSSPFDVSYWNGVYGLIYYNNQIAFKGATIPELKDTIYFWNDGNFNAEFALPSGTGKIINYNDDLYVSKAMSSGGLGGSLGLPTLYRWNGLELDSLSYINFAFDSTYLSNHITSKLIVFQEKLYICGNIESSIHPEFKEILTWDGTEFGSLNNGISGFAALAMEMEIFNDELYIGGLFWQDEGNPTNCIVKWDGDNFLPVGVVGANSRVDCLVSHGGYLYAAGFFTMMDNIPCRIARWDGEIWEAYNNDNFHFYGSEDDIGTIKEMIVFRDTLHIAKGFQLINGEYFNHIAKYNGALPINPNVGINEITNELNIDIYPNPTTNELHFNFGSLLNIDTEVKIYNPIGQIVKEITIPAWEQTYVLDTSLLSKGVYFIKVQLGKAIQTKKIIIQ